MNKKYLWLLLVLLLGVYMYDKSIQISCAETYAPDLDYKGLYDCYQQNSYYHRFLSYINHEDDYKWNMTKYSYEKCYPMYQRCEETFSRCMYESRTSFQDDNCHQFYKTCRVNVGWCLQEAWESYDELHPPTSHPNYLVICCWIFNIWRTYYDELPPSRTKHLMLMMVILLYEVTPFI